MGGKGDRLMRVQEYYAESGDTFPGKFRNRILKLRTKLFRFGMKRENIREPISFNLPI